jgi:hypothetical protein
MLYSRVGISVSLHSKGVLRVEQGLNATEEVSYTIALRHDCCYTEYLGQWFSKKVFLHGEDHDGCVGHCDLKPRGDFYSVRNRHA